HPIHHASHAISSILKTLALAKGQDSYEAVPFALPVRRKVAKSSCAYFCGLPDAAVENLWPTSWHRHASPTVERWNNERTNHDKRTNCGRDSSTPTSQRGVCYFSYARGAQMQPRATIKRHRSGIRTRRGSSLCWPACYLVTGPGPLPAALQQPLYIAQSLGVLAAIVAVHEAGHFAAARLQGIHVSKFAIGFGPPLVTFTRGSVEYSLRLIPMGGFVAFPDDDPKSNIPKPRCLTVKASLYPSLPAAHVLAWPCAVLLTRCPDDPNLLRNRSIPERGAVISAGGHCQHGLRVCSAAATGRCWLGPGGLAAPDLVDISVTPDLAKDGKGPTGLTSTVVGGLTALFTNFGKVAGQLSGPVAIVAAGSQIAKTDAAGLFQYCAIVNINLAVVNLLPLPALDGGYLVLLLLEAAWGGRKLPQSVEQGFAVLSAAGFLLLMVAGVSLVVKDTMGLLPGL
ncbi:hypothetical protein QJQ45_014661, partial [Haematococcus lacustris]